MDMDIETIRRMMSSMADYLERKDESPIAANDVRQTLGYIETKTAEIERLRQWVNDLHSGMYINCVYCGHRYGPDGEVPGSMADVLKAHIEQCPEHPMSKCKAQNEMLWAELTASGRRAVLMQAEIERLNAALDAIIAFEVYYGEGNAEELQAIARAARSNKKESN